MIGGIPEEAALPPAEPFWFAGRVIQHTQDQSVATDPEPVIFRGVCAVSLSLSFWR